MEGPLRHQYVPLFADILDSRVWEEPAPTRAVWIYMMVSADPEGFLSGTVRSVARQANVTLDEARAALEFLCSEDPESRDDEHGGRMIAPVERGWLVLNLEKWRGRARVEAERARKRRWAQKERDAGREECATCGGTHYTHECPESRRPVDASSEYVDAPKPIPTPKPKPTETQHPEPSGVVPVEYLELPDWWKPSDELRTDARLGGIPDEWLDERIAALRGRRIGGKTPVTNIDTYIRGLFKSWRRWWETEQLKRQNESRTERATGIPAGRPPELPRWVHADHMKLATERGIDPLALVALAKRFAKEQQLHRSEPEPGVLFRLFKAYIESASEKRSNTAA